MAGTLQRDATFDPPGWVSDGSNRWAKTLAPGVIGVVRPHFTHPDLWCMFASGGAAPTTEEQEAEPGAFFTPAAAMHAAESMHRDGDEHGRELVPPEEVKALLAEDRSSFDRVFHCAECDWTERLPNDGSAPKHSVDGICNRLVVMQGEAKRCVGTVVETAEEELPF